MAGDRIGRAEVRVDADTKPFVRQAEKGGTEGAKKAGSAFDDSFQVDKGRLNARISAGLKDSGKKAGYQFGQDFVDAVELESIKLALDVDSLEKDFASIGDLDTDKLSESIRNSAQKAFARGEFQKEARRVGKKTSEALSDAIEIDFSSLSFDIDSTQIENDGRSKGRKYWESFEAGFKSRSRGLSSQLNDLFDQSWFRSTAREIGEDSGGGFSDGFQKSIGRGGGIPKTWKIIAKLVALFSQEITVALYGVVSAATALASSVYGAALALGALAPIAVSAAAGIGAVVAAAWNVGPAMGSVTSELGSAIREGRAFNAEAAEIQDALKNLGPEAQAFARSWIDVVAPFVDFQKAAESRLFVGMGEALADLNEKQLPSFREGLLSITDVANVVIIDALERMANFDLGAMFTNAAPGLESFGVGINNLIETFFRFSDAVTETGNSLARTFEQWAAGVLEATNAGIASGGLVAQMEIYKQSLFDVLGLLGAFGSAMNTVFMAGQSTGSGMLQSLTDILNRWNEWMQTVEGQQALETFFANGAAIMGALTPILVSLRDLFNTVVTPSAIQSFEVLALAVAGIVDVIAEAITIFGQLGIIEAVSSLVIALADALIPLSPILQEVAGLIGNALADAAAVLAPVFDQIIGALTPLISAFGSVLQAILPPLIGIFTTLVGVVTSVFTALEPMWPLVAELAITLGELLAPILDVVAELFAELEPVLAEVATVIADASADILPKFIEMFQEIAPALLDVVTIFADFLTALLPLVPVILDLIFVFADMAANVLPIVAGMVSVVTSFLRIFADLITGAIALAVEWLSGALQIAADMFGILGDAATAAKDFMVDAFEWVETSFRNINDVIKDALSSVYETMVEPFRSAFNTIRDLLSRLPGLGSIAPNFEVSTSSTTNATRRSGSSASPMMTPMSVVQNITVPQTDPYAVAASLVNDLSVAARI